MRLDHLSYAAGPEGLEATADKLGALLGVPFTPGGIHPRWGTQNAILPLRGGLYIEVVEALEHPASDKAPFGQAVKARSALGGGWLGWAIAVDAERLAEIEKQLGRSAVDGNRKLPDGVTELLWKQIGVNGMIADPQLPYFVHWLSPVELHPSNAGTDVILKKIEISGEPRRVREYMGADLEERVDYFTGRPADDVKVEWVAEHGTPGLVACQFETPSNGTVRI